MKYCFKIYRKALFILIIPVLTISSPLYADFECTSTVNYVWEYTSEPLATMDKKMDKMEGKSKKKTVVAPMKEEYTVQFSSRHTKDESEEMARKKLQTLLDKDVIEARAECKRTHENHSGCVSTKFTSMGSALRQAGFSARKALEQSINEDCKKQTGRCLKAEPSEIVCKEMKAEGESGEEEGEGSEKDEKKK